LVVTLLFQRGPQVTLKISREHPEPDEQCDLENRALVDGHVAVLGKGFDQGLELKAPFRERAQIDDRAQVTLVTCVEIKRPAFGEDQHIDLGNLEGDPSSTWNAPKRGLRIAVDGKNAKIANLDVT
jgi:hypothetical protein